MMISLYCIHSATPRVCTSKKPHRPACARVLTRPAHPSYILHPKQPHFNREETKTIVPVVHIRNKGAHAAKGGLELSPGCGGACPSWESPEIKTPIAPGDLAL